MTNAELLNECGTKLSAMDAHLAKATELMGAGMYSQVQTEISAAHALLAPAGAALAEVAKAVLGTPPVEPPVEPPVVDPNVLDRMRAAPGQLAKWASSVVTDAEVKAMGAIYGTARVAQQLAFYGVGLPGNVYVRQTGPGAYEFINTSQQWQPDLDGAGDALVAQNAGGPQNVIEPLNPPA